MMQSNNDIENDIALEKFDDLFVGNPVDIEKNLKALLKKAAAKKNKSIYLQIMSQIALAEALQKKFSEAHETLNQAEAEVLLSPEYDLARIRILFERGRVFHQSDDIDNALPLFKKSYELSKQLNLDFHTINAAHMIAIVEPDVLQKILWNNEALDLIKNTADERAKAWAGPLYNNLAHNYLEAKRYSDAKSCFEECKKYGEERNDPIIIRGAKWGIGCALRHQDCLEEARVIQEALVKEYDEVLKKGELPLELIAAGRGLVYEELLEIHLAIAKQFANLAYRDLSKDPWFVKLAAARLEKIKQLQNA